MTTGSYKTRFLLFANARGAGTLSTAKCPTPGTHRASNARGLLGVGMLTAGIDWHIRSGFPRFAELLFMTYYEEEPLPSSTQPFASTTLTKQNIYHDNIKISLDHVEKKN